MQGRGCGSPGEAFRVSSFLLSQRNDDSETRHPIHDKMAITIQLRFQAEPIISVVNFVSSL